MTVLIVDWLGRGGIAQCTEAWAKELDCHGLRTAIVTRPGRELGSDARAVITGTTHRNRLRAHRSVAVAAVRAIEELGPSVVVIQNHVLPPLERAVDTAARRFGAKVVRVVHDHRLHSRWAGSQYGLTSLLECADVVVAHSAFVAGRIHDAVRREIDVLPLPVQVGVVAHGGSPAPAELQGEGRLAVHFGVVHRQYKGTSMVLQTAALRPPGWRFGVLGAGAPSSSCVSSVSGYVSSQALAGALELSDATLLPYEFATQSAAVVLAQALGSVAVATSVGGIVEQIDHGVTGLLLPQRAPASQWRDALSTLDHDGDREAMANRGRATALLRHQAFSNGVRMIVLGA